MSKLSRVQFNRLMQMAKKELKGNKPDVYWKELYEYIRPYVSYIARGTDNNKMDVSVEEQLVALIPSIVLKYDFKKTESAHGYLTYALRNKKNSILSNWYNRHPNIVIQKTVSCFDSEGNNSFDNLIDERTSHIQEIEHNEQVEELKELLHKKLEEFLETNTEGKIGKEEKRIILENYISTGEKILLNYKLQQVERVITLFRKFIKESETEFKAIQEV